MRRSTGLLGLIGVILLLFAGLALWVTRAASTFDIVYIGVHAVVGVLALIAYLSSGLENLRTFVGERSTKYGASTVLASVFFIGILGAVNYIAARYDHRWDVTETGVHSLSPQSLQVVDGLENDMQMQAFVEAGLNPPLRALLARYQAAAPEVSFELIDPDRQPELVERYGIKTFNSVRLDYGGSSSVVAQPSEETLTNAIIKLTRTSQQTVCVIEGHGEPDIEDVQNARGMAQVKTALENENYEVKKVFLASLESVPAECAIAMIAGPAKPFLPHELTALDAYLRGGGRGLFLLATRRAEEFADFLEVWGVRVGSDVVVDQVVRLFQGPSLGLAPIVDSYEKQHEITRVLEGRTIFPMTRSITAEKDGKPGLRVTEIVRTSPSSWAETDVIGVLDEQRATLDESDRRGPVPVVVVVEADLTEMGATDGGDARLAVFGSTEFANNQHLDGSFFNRDLFLNTVAWLLGESDLLSIRPRAFRASRVNLSQAEGTIIFFLSVLVVPELLLIAGLAVWWRRE